MMIQKTKKIVAGTEVDPDATELLFQAEDVAELVAEVTGEEVVVEADDSGEAVTFNVGDEDVYTVEAEGTEEILEASTKVLRVKRPVKASTNRRPAKRTIRKVPSNNR
jgi:nucleotide-binding universal stress UspA family protein